MAATVPTIVTGSGPQTITVAPATRQMLIENTDLVNNIGVSWNGAGGTWTMAAGTRLGILLIGGVTRVVITGSGSWQLMLQP